MIGQTLSHFKITAKLGEGGMGEVYRAEDTTLGRQVAIKVLPEAVAGDAERLARFEREAKVLASLNHQNIASIYGLEEIEGRRLLVMELAEGETLAERLERGPIPVEEALPIAQQIAEALEAAHDKGIIHRDLKPANVVVDAQGQAKVLDFGLAKALESPTSEASSEGLSLSPTLTAQMTTAGVLLGTAAYMSPEQARGQEADRRSDLWAFGVLVYEMLTAERLFAGSTVSDTLAGVLRADPDWDKLPADTPASVRRLLRRCLEREARYRLSDASSAWLEIQDARTRRDEGIETTKPAETEAPGWQRLAPWGAAAALAAALAITLWAPWGAPASPRLPQPVMRLEVSISDKSPDLDLGSNYVLSPDGGSLAYVVIDDEQYELSIRSLDRLGSTKLVAGSGADSTYHPFFSPDGEWLGYVTPSELKKVPVTGGAAITLCAVNRSRGAAWAPDDTIVFTPDPESPLMRVSAAGGEPEPLTTLDEAKGETSHRWPQVVRGGEVVLFTSQTEAAESFNEANIEALVLATGERKVIHQAGFFARYMPGGYLLFLNDNTLFARPFDLAALEATGPPVPIAQGIALDLPDGGAQVDVGANGTLVYVSGQEQLEEYAILWVDREGGTEMLWDERGTFAGPRLSPSGRQLAIMRVKDDNPDVWVHDLERAVSTRLTFDPAGDFLPIWSPDEQYLVFGSARETPPTLYRKRADGSGEAERLTEHDGFLAANSWSSDGRFLAGVTLGQSFDLWVLDLEGDGKVETFLSTPFIEWYPSFSPDGRWIAYMSDESGRYEVYVRPYPQRGGRWQISNEGGGQPKWSADGDEIYYRTETGLMVVEVEAATDTLRVGRPRELFDGPFRGGMTGLSSSNILPDWELSADGQRFVLLEESRQQGRGTVVTMVFNFQQELDQLLSGSGR